MPQVVPAALVAGGVAAGGAAIASAPVGVAFAQAFFTTLVAGAVSQALSKKAQFDSLAALSTRGGQSVSVRESAASHKIIYGETRVGGTIVHLETTGEDKLLHVVVALAAHEVESIGDIYLGDSIITSTRYQKQTYTGINCWIRPYGDPEDHFLKLERPWHMEDLGEGPVKVYDSSLIYSNAFEDWETVFQITGTANNNDGVYRRVITGDTDIYLSFVRLERIDGGTVTYEDVPSATITVGYAWAFKHLGLPSQTADLDLVSVSDDWTTTDRLQNIAYVYVRLAWNSQVFPTGLENISAIVKGKKVYDPRTSTTVWSDNAALCVADFLCDLNAGYGENYATEIDETALIAAASICDEPAQRSGKSDEPQFTCNGIIDTANDTMANLESLLSAMGGRAVFSTGKWFIYPAAYNTPSVTLDEDDLLDSVAIQSRVPRRELFNAVKGLFISPADNYQPTDFPAQVSTTYATEDGGTIFRDMDLPFTTSVTMAQRLARIELLKIRQQIAVQLRCKLPALKIKPGDVINLTNTRLGWESKPFEVLEWSLSFTDDEIGVSLGLRETHSTIYEWDTGLELPYDPAPNTNLPDPFVVIAPTNFSATSGGAHLFEQADGTIVTRIKVTWSHSNPSAIMHYEISWDKGLTGNYLEGSTTTPLYYIAPVKDGENYAIRVRAVNYFGVKSAYIHIDTHIVTGKSEPPPDVDSFLVSRQPDGTREFTWSLINPPADLAGYQIRYSSGLGGTWATMTDLHQGLLKASPYETNLLAAGTYTVGIKAVDTSGNESNSAKLIESTLGDPRLKNMIYIENLAATGFPGTKTDCDFDRSAMALIPGSNDTWSSIPGNDWSDWNAWNVDPVSSMQYEHIFIDLGVIVEFKLLVTVVVDGGIITVEERHSDDDISYSDWQLATGAITCRYVQPRITVANPQLTGVTDANIMFDADTVYETIQDLHTATITGTPGDFRLPLTQNFVKIFSVNIALQNVGAGWTWEIIDKDAALGPHIRIYNSSNIPANATIDAEIKGV